MTLPIPTEAAEQRSLTQYLDLLGVLWCHVPNGGYRNKIEAARFQGQGVKPGVPDVLIFTPPPSKPGKLGTAIELKRQKGGKLSKDQRRWLDQLGSIGWEVCVAKGFRVARQQLQALGYEGR